MQRTESVLLLIGNAITYRYTSILTFYYLIKWLYWLVVERINGASHSRPGGPAVASLLAGTRAVADSYFCPLATNVMQIENGELQKRA